MKRALFLLLICCCLLTACARQKAVFVEPFHGMPKDTAYVRR